MEATASFPLYQFEPLRSFNHVRVLALQPAQDHQDDLKASITRRQTFDTLGSTHGGRLAAQRSVHHPAERDTMADLFTEIWMNPRSRETMSVMSRLRSPQNDIFSLLWDFHTSECRDPADRIRAIYGLASLDTLQLENLDRAAQTPWSALYQRLSKLDTAPGSWTLL